MNSSNGKLPQVATHLCSVSQTLQPSSSICHHLICSPQRPASPPTNACSAPRLMPTWARAWRTCRKPTPSPFHMYSIVKTVKVRSSNSIACPFSPPKRSLHLGQILTRAARPSQLSCRKDCNWRHVYPGHALAFAAMLTFTQLPAEHVHLTRAVERSATEALDTSTLFVLTCATRTT
jgi:hypothetical protein